MIGGLPTEVQRLLQGDLRALAAPAADAWGPLARELQRLHGPPGSTAPSSTSSPAASSSRAPTGPTAWATLYRALGAWLGDRDPAGLANPPSDQARVNGVARAYADVYAGRAPDIGALNIGALTRPSESLLERACAVHALCLGSFAAADDPKAAVSLARDASRRADALGFLLESHLAHAALARARRLRGQPYAAARIARSLLEVSAPAWRQFLEWELALSGDPGAGSGSSAIDRLVSAASLGDRERFEAAMDAPPPGWAARAVERDAAACMLDAERSPSPAAERWCRGETESPPFGARPGPAAGLGHDGLLLVGPGSEARRIAAGGRRLLAGARHEVDPSQASARGRAVLCRLATAGPRPREALWALVYGFGYVPVKHSGALRVLLHRARALLGGAGEIAEGEAGLRLVPARPLMIADPATERSLEDRLLALVAASQGKATARELAQALSVSLRAVQGLLGGLVEEGTCVQARDGRAVLYGVEDTTYRTAIRTVGDG